MPQKCNVPICRTNYRNGSKVFDFSFPTDLELRRKWIISVYRKTNSKVCEKYFPEGQIRREVSTLDEKSGRIVRLSKPCLVEIFPGCPAYMSFAVPSLMVRENPEERREKIDRNCIARAIDDSIASFNTEE